MAGQDFFFTSGQNVIQSEVRNLPGSLSEAWGTNNSINEMFVQIHNNTGVLGGGEIPEISIRVPAGAEWNIDRFHGPLGFSTGIVIAYSTTADTFTAPGSAVGWIHATHRE